MSTAPVTLRCSEAENRFQRMAAGYSISKGHIHPGRKLRIIYVGAGASGLLLAYKNKYHCYEKDVEVQVYEKNHDIGGTWLENRWESL